MKATRSIFAYRLVGWQRWIARAVCASWILILGSVRIATDAEYAFATLSLIPVIVLAWADSARAGLAAAVAASVVWAYPEIGAGRHFSAAWVPWLNAVTRLATYTLVAFLVAKVRGQLDHVDRLSRADALTGLQNRRAFFETGTGEADRARRYSRPVAIGFLDLDNFKNLNDERGHHVGDRALRATARALLDSLRSTDIVARLGGDEFAFLLPETDYEAASHVAGKVLVAVNAALEPFSPVSASIGVACFATADRSFEAMLRSADALMYETKTGGKGKVLVQRL
jgi:diguanylate cyclase (GGDEF)-like protein